MVLKLNKNFCFLREPYISKEKFWLFDKIEGDIYSLSKEAFSFLEKIKKGKTKRLSHMLLEDLKRIGVIKDEN